MEILALTRISVCAKGHSGPLDSRISLRAFTLSSFCFGHAQDPVAFYVIRDVLQVCSLRAFTCSISQVSSANMDVLEFRATLLQLLAQVVL